MKCLKCDYNWTPRVEMPKECPECKVRLGKMIGVIGEKENDRK